MPKSTEVIYEKSDNELWPFFTLSKASSSLTILPGAKFAAQKKGAENDPVLFVEGSEEHFFNTQLEPSEAGQVFVLHAG